MSNDMTRLLADLRRLRRENRLAQQPRKAVADMTVPELTTALRANLREAKAQTRRMKSNRK